MQVNLLREQLIQEISQLPETKLQEILDVVHFFRIGLEGAQDKSQNIRQFAGIWSDMDEQLFAEFESDWQARRQQAFKQRNR